MWVVLRMRARRPIAANSEPPQRRFAGAAAHSDMHSRIRGRATCTYPTAAAHGDIHSRIRAALATDAHPNAATRADMHYRMRGPCDLRISEFAAADSARHRKRTGDDDPLAMPRARQVRAMRICISRMAAPMQEMYMRMHAVACVRCGYAFPEWGAHRKTHPRWGRPFRAQYRRRVACFTKITPTTFVCLFVCLFAAIRVYTVV